MNTHLSSQEIDRIREDCEVTPHIGPECEGIMTDRESSEVVHRINGIQPVTAVRAELKRRLGERADGLLSTTTMDVVESTLETNPNPLRSGISSAAAQRCMAIIMDLVLRGLDDNVQLHHGASLRPPHSTSADITQENDISPWKKMYYEYLIGVHGDRMSAAAGDHLNLSAPWLNNDQYDTTAKMIQMTGRLRLLAGALSMALTASSPLHYFANGHAQDAKFGTALTPWSSARLGEVWPRRQSVDVPELFQGPVEMVETLRRLTEYGELKTGRDIWLPVRPQPGRVDSPSIEEVCANNGINLEVEAGQAELRKSLFKCFDGDANGSDPIEKWRREMLNAFIDAPRNRVEIRTFETPPAFENQTPYEYLKAIHSFFELLFIYLTRNPDFAQNLSYDSISLQIAKDNESKVLRGDMDTKIKWIPTKKMITPRELLNFLLENMKNLIDGFGRSEDIEILRRIAAGALTPPSERIRKEVGDWYQINVEQRHNPRLLPDDDGSESYASSVLKRTRTAMDREEAQIRSDLARIPLADRPTIENLLNLITELKSNQ